MNERVKKNLANRGAEKFLGLLWSILPPLKTRTLRLRSEVKIHSILSLTSGRRHYWCESNVGRIDKPIWAAPRRLRMEFEDRLWR